MKKYKLNRLVKLADGTEVILPAIEESAAGRAAYLQALRKMLRELRAQARTATDRLNLDILAQIATSLATVAESTVNRVLSLEAQRHTDTFIATARRALGVDLRAVVRQEDLGDHLRLAATRNSALIKSLAQDTVKRVELAVVENLIAGNSAETLRKQLVKDFGIADSRAKLIASNEMSSLNADLNRIRHEQAGITEYRWTTSRDERVRERHKALEGKVYRYGEATGAEGGLPPGKPIRCRCIARAVVQF